MENNKSNGFGIVLILVLIALCGYFVWMYFNSDNKKEDSSVNKTNSETKEDTLSEDEALLQIEEKYILALNLYKIKDKFVLSSEKTTIDTDEYYEITDYDQVMNEVFNDKGKKQFEDYYKDYIKKNENKIYVKVEVIDTEINYDDSYKETTFEKESIEKDKITYNAKAVYDEDEDEKEFVIVKKNDKWLVDKFHFPYKKKSD